MAVQHGAITAGRWTLERRVFANRFCIRNNHSLSGISGKKRFEPFLAEIVCNRVLMPPMALF